MGTMKRSDVHTRNYLIPITLLVLCPFPVAYAPMAHMPAQSNYEPSELMSDVACVSPC